MKKLLLMAAAFSVLFPAMLSALQTNTYLFQASSGMDDKTAGFMAEGALVSRLTETAGISRTVFTDFDGKTAGKSETKSLAKNVNISGTVVTGKKKLGGGVLEVTYVCIPFTVTNLPPSLTNAAAVTLSTNLKADLDDFEKFQIDTKVSLVENYLKSKMAAELHAPYAKTIKAVWILTAPAAEKIDQDNYSLKVTLKAAIE